MGYVYKPMGNFRSGLTVSTAASAATLMDQIKASGGFTEAPPPALNDANDIAKATPYIGKARTGGRDDDWILGALRARNYSNSIIDGAFKLQGGFRGSNTSFMTDSIWGGTQTPPSQDQTVGKEENKTKKSSNSTLFIILGVAGIAAFLILRKK